MVIQTFLWKKRGDSDVAPFPSFRFLCCWKSWSFHMCQWRHFAELLTKTPLPSLQVRSAKVPTDISTDISHTPSVWWANPTKYQFFLTQMILSMLDLSKLNLDIWNWLQNISFQFWVLQMGAVNYKPLQNCLKAHQFQTIFPEPDINRIDDQELLRWRGRSEN